MATLPTISNYFLSILKIILRFFFVRHWVFPVTYGREVYVVRLSHGTYWKCFCAKSSRKLIDLFRTFRSFIFYRRILCRPGVTFLTNLDHETKDEDHRNAGYDVRMILNDKFMTENWWILVRTLSSLNCNHFYDFYGFLNFFTVTTRSAKPGNSRLHASVLRRRINLYWFWFSCGCAHELYQPDEKASR